MLTMPRLFLCHHSFYKDQVAALAEELRLRGIAPWLDKDGGFIYGDDSNEEARRVIADPMGTYGLLLYATPGIFDEERAFIREVELKTALQRKDDTDYLLVAVTHDMSHEELAKQSLKKTGEDLSRFHGGSVRIRDNEEISSPEIRPQLVKVAQNVLCQRLPKVLKNDSPFVGINFCTSAYLAPLPDDILDIDAVSLAHKGTDKGWKRVLSGLRDVREAIRQIQGRPTIRIRGSKQQTGAFLIGRVFTPSTVKEIQVQQEDKLWSSDCDSSIPSPLNMNLKEGAAGSYDLFVTVSSSIKIRESVRRFIQESGTIPTASLHFENPSDDQTLRLDSGTACAIARQVSAEIRKLSGSRTIDRIHMFTRVPNGLMTLIGHNLNASPPIQLYEFTDGHYLPSVCVKSSEFAPI